MRPIIAAYKTFWTRFIRTGINAVTLAIETALVMAAQELQQQDDALDLQSRSLTALPPLSTALCVLTLTRNRISDLAPCGALVNLERLDASRNNVRVRSHAVAALPRLKELLLYSNHLRRTGLPEKIRAPLALLDLRFNTKLTGDLVRELSLIHI